MHCLDCAGFTCQSNMARHRSTFLCHTKLINRLTRPPLDMRCHRNHGANRHDTRTTNTGYQDIVGLFFFKTWALRFRQQL